MNTNSTDQVPERKKRLDDLLLMIGGLEESIRIAQENKEWEFLDVIRPLKVKYYERLRRVAYGLPEETRLPAEEES
ncbi:hypothetical protein UFOVP1439_35 [uncultured Caudovirales phage]|uniref:Uncharacterized protein n=1 Tax=uncultured Caudovirales phage TaxID=2100421 RepID=A0A6J5SEN8_9CAUD|nr:hypothetical protein UFOVP1085_15 [uncultured Caudovirales phage]CAB4212712.1 hypothetical protein UFOVP1439_35 [uncultured Caudovirales phage]